MIFFFFFFHPLFPFWQKINAGAGFEQREHYKVFGGQGDGKKETFSSLLIFQNWSSSTLTRQTQLQLVVEYKGGAIFLLDPPDPPQISLPQVNVQH